MIIAQKLLCFEYSNICGFFNNYSRWLYFSIVVLFFVVVFFFCLFVCFLHQKNKKQNKTQKNKTKTVTHIYLRQ